MQDRDVRARGPVRGRLPAVRGRDVPARGRRSAHNRSPGQPERGLFVPGPAVGKLTHAFSPCTVAAGLETLPHQGLHLIGTDTMQVANVGKTDMIAQGHFDDFTFNHRVGWTGGHAGDRVQDGDADRAADDRPASCPSLAPRRPSGAWTAMSHAGSGRGPCGCCHRPGCRSGDWTSSFPTHPCRVLHLAASRHSFARGRAASCGSSNARMDR